MKTRTGNKKKKNQKGIKIQKLNLNQLLQVRGGEGESIDKDFD